MPSREVLYQRVHARTENMLAQGWMEEVRRLIDTGVPETAKAFYFIGYRELGSVLQGEMSLEEARAAIQQATRRYAKRQITWFRREKGVHWLAGFGDDPKTQADAFEYVRAEASRAVSGATGLEV
jgi:tRNA dimethylallyltransferase